VARTTFATRGTRTVRLRVRQTNGRTAVREVGVRVNAAPTASFSWSPSALVAGQFANLVSTSSDPEGAVTLSWDLDGDGLYGDGSTAQVKHPFTLPGIYEVGLRATDSDGVARTVRRQIAVAAAPAPPAPPASDPAPAPPVGPSGDQPVAPGGTPAPLRLRPISPFPVIRIAGVVLRRGALIRILSVRAPRGVQVQVRCKGRSCPVGAVARTSATRVVRFSRFQRRLRAGTRIEFFVRKGNRIGKYTRFIIRAGKAPRRVDRCLFPGKSRPERCP
jgi:PKD domain